MASENSFDVYVNLVPTGSDELTELFKKWEKLSKNISSNLSNASTMKSRNKDEVIKTKGLTKTGGKPPAQDEEEKTPPPSKMRWRDMSSKDSRFRGQNDWNDKYATKYQDKEWWDEQVPKRRAKLRRLYEGRVMPEIRASYNLLNRGIGTISDGNGHANSFGINSFNIEDIWRTIVDKSVDFFFGKIPDMFGDIAENIRNYISEKVDFDILTGEDFDPENKVTPPWEYGKKVFKRGLYTSATAGGYDNTWYDENGWAEDGQYDFNPHYTHGDNTSSRRGNLPMSMGRGGSPSNPYYVPDFQGDFKDRDWGYYKPNWGRWMGNEQSDYNPDWVFGGYRGPRVDWSRVLGPGSYTPNWGGGGRGWYTGDPLGDIPLLGGDIGSAPKQTKQKSNDTILDAEYTIKQDKTKTKKSKKKKDDNDKYNKDVEKTGKVLSTVGKVFSVVGWIGSKAFSVFKMIGGLFADVFKVALKSFFKPATMLFKGFTSLLKEAAQKSQIIQAIHQIVIVPFIIMFEYLLIPAIKVVAPMITKMVKLIVQHKDTLLKWGETIAEIFTAVLEPFVDMLGDGSTFWENPIQGIFEAFTQVLLNIQSWLKENNDWIGPALVEVFKAGMDYLSSSVGLMSDIIDVVFKSLADAMESKEWSTLLDSISSALVKVFDAINEVITSSKVLPTVMKFMALIADLLVQAVQVALAGGDYSAIEYDADQQFKTLMETSQFNRESLYYDKSTGRIYGQRNMMGLGGETSLSSMHSSYNSDLFTEQSTTNSNIYFLGDFVWDAWDSGGREAVSKIMDSTLDSMGAT